MVVIIFYTNSIPFNDLNDHKMIPIINNTPLAKVPVY